MSIPSGPKITLKCENPDCGKTFMRRIIDQARTHRIKKNGSPGGTYCCGPCSHKGQSRSPVAPFRQFMYAIKRRVYIANRVASDAKASILKNCDITPEWLKLLWEHQRGICPYTGIEMSLARPNTKLHAASLDRIDSNQGYMMGNVEFVCRFVNMGKQDRSKQETLDFFSKIKTLTT